MLNQAGSELTHTQLWTKTREYHKNPKSYFYILCACGECRVFHEVDSVQSQNKLFGLATAKQKRK